MEIYTDSSWVLLHAGGRGAAILNFQNKLILNGCVSILQAAHAQASILY